MADLDFSIGLSIAKKDFLGMSGPPKKGHRRMSFMTRSGSDQFVAYRDGDRAAKTVIVTEADCGSDLNEFIDGYYQMVGGVPHVIVYRGQAYGYFWVTDVQIVESPKVLYLSRRVNTSKDDVPSPYIVTAQWEVLSLSLAVPE